MKFIIVLGFLLLFFPFLSAEIARVVIDSDIDTNWNITGSNYLVNNSGILEVNATKLNETINLLENNTLYYAGGVYIYKNGSNYFILNETKLNETIDLLDDDTTYTAGEVYVYLSGTQFLLNETYLNQTISSLDTDTNLTGADIVNFVGNWTLDSVNYYNTTQVDTEIENANTSMKTYVDGTFILQSDEGNLNVNNSNTSDYWAGFNDTNDSWFENILNVFSLNLTKLEIFGDNLWCTLTGCNMTGPIDMGGNNLNNVNNTKTFRITFLDSENESYIKIGDSNFYGTENAMVFGNNDPNLVDGIITTLFYAQENKTLSWTQFGKNNSYGGHGNSLGIVPNYLGIENFSSGGVINMTQLSNYLTICDTFGVDCTFAGDTRGRARMGPSGIMIPGGPLLWTMGDLEVWGESKIHEGLEIEKDFLYLGDGDGDFDIYGEPLHLKIERQENITTGIGPITLFEITFEGVSTGTQPPTPFLETADGTGNSNREWSVRNDARCNSNPCARAKGGDGGDIRGMIYYTNTTDVSSMNLSFYYGSDNMDADADECFKVDMNNNVGSGWVNIFTNCSVDGDINPSVFEIFAVPVSMNNKSNVSIRFNHNADGTNQESFVDDIKLNGTAGTPVIMEVTKYDASIEFGGGTYSSADCEIFYNDSTGTLELGRDPNCNVEIFNATFTTIEVGSQNITGNLDISDNITFGGLIMGNGSQLTGINHNALEGLQGCSGDECFHLNQSVNDKVIANYLGWVNATLLALTHYNKTQIDTLISDANTSLKNYVDNTFYNTTEVDTEIENANTSMKGYVDGLNSTMSSWVDSLFVRFTEIVGLVGNWTNDKTNVAFTNESETFEENVAFDKNISLDGSQINLNNNATIGRNDTNTRIYIDDNGNFNLVLG